MDRKRNLLGALAAFGFLVLILDSRTAVEGAGIGIDLCIKTVIPSLFPFFVLSILLTNALSGTDFKFLRILAGFLRIPEGAASVLFPAFLGGYPVGAQCVGTLYHRNKLSKENAERMLAFCNNAGPSFLFGMVSVFFPNIQMVWLLWLIHIVSALLTAVVTRPMKAESMPILPEKEISGGRNVLLTAAKAMVTVCCWVVLFRTLTAFLKKWFLWLFPAWIQVLLTGFLELANGCCELAVISDLGVRFVGASCMLAFGGICVFAQTASVTDGLSLRWFYRGKMLQSLFSFLLSSAIALENSWIYAAMVPVFVVILRKVQNRYSIPAEIPV